MPELNAFIRRRGKAMPTERDRPGRITALASALDRNSPLPAAAVASRPRWDTMRSPLWWSCRTRSSLPSVIRARVRSADMPHERYMLCTRTDDRFQIVTSVRYDRSNRLTWRRETDCTVISSQGGARPPGMSPLEKRSGVNRSGWCAIAEATSDRSLCCWRGSLGPKPLFVSSQAMAAEAAHVRAIVNDLGAPS